MIASSCIDYIKDFLTDGHSGNKYIHYGKPDESEKPVIIVAADFFENEVYGTEQLLPVLPLKELENKLPVLFGNAVIERRKSQVIIDADLIDMNDPRERNHSNQKQKY